MIVQRTFIQLRDAIAKEIRGGIQETDMMNWLSRASLEFIGRAGVGYKFGALNAEAPHDEYTAAMKSLL